MAAAGSRKRTRNDVPVQLTYKFVATLFGVDSSTGLTVLFSMERVDYHRIIADFVRAMLCTSGYAHEKSLIDLCEFICKHDGTSTTKSFGPYMIQLEVVAVDAAIEEAEIKS
jgi:hypothetical protein